VGTPLRLERIIVAIGCASAACVAGAAHAPEPTAQSNAAITHGVADSGDPAVVTIVGASGTTECSGTLVAAHMVLTAGHCTVADVVQGASVVIGSSLADAVVTIPIAKAVAHPQFDLSTLTNDIGLLVLASAATTSPIALASSAPDAGATVQIVGWGLTAEDAGDTGQKREGTTTVTAVDPTTFSVAAAPSQPCRGDSGGPALVTVGGVVSVVGVTSNGDASCDEGATYTRVDAYLASFLEPTIAAYAPGSAATGQRCLFPEQCAGGASDCVVATDDVSLGYCTTTCQSDAACPSGMVCSAGQGGSRCRYPLPTPGTYGASCTSDSDCVEGTCTTTGICALRCVPGDSMCPAGFECVNTADIDFFCVATPAQASAPGGGGSHCALTPAGRAAPLPWIAIAAITLGAARRRVRRRRCRF
jgi:hypothetical protein